MEIRETAVVIDGVRAPVREAGQAGSEEAIVFVHGNPGSGRDWAVAIHTVPVEYAERQRGAFPSAEVAVLDGSGHWPLADDPERVADLVVPFLRRQTEAAPPGG